MVSDSDLVSVLEGSAGQPLEIGLFPFGDDIEDVTEFDADGLILWGMVDLVLSDELLGPRLVGLIDTEDAGREGLSKIVLLRVLELDIDADLLLYCLAGTVITLEIVALAIENKLFRYGEVGGGEEIYLLGLVLFDGRWPLQGVEVVLEESLLIKLWWWSALHCHGNALRSATKSGLILNPIDISGNQFEFGVAIGGATLVGDGDPAVEICLRVSLGEDDDIVCAPIETIGQVRGFDAVAVTAAVIERPDESRLGDQIARKPIKANLRHVGRIDDDLVANFPDLTTIIGEKCRTCRNELLGIVFELTNDESKFLADVLFEQFFRVEQIILVALFDDVEIIGRGQ